MAQAPARTLKTEMECLHQEFGVNFVYDSSLDIDVPYSGKPMKELAAKGDLTQCLTTLFQGTGINFEIMKKYIVLSKADSKKKPRDYTIFIEEQHDTINESVVTAIVDPKRNSTQTGLKRIDSKDINSGFALFRQTGSVAAAMRQTGRRQDFSTGCCLRMMRQGQENT